MSPEHGKLKTKRLQKISHVKTELHLLSAYDQIINSWHTIVIIQAADKSEPTAVYVFVNLYCNSLLLRSVRDRGSIFITPKYKINGMLICSLKYIF